MAGRDEGTGALIEPRNIDQQGLCTCHNRHSPNIIMYLRFCETKNAPHTEILTLPGLPLTKIAVGILQIWTKSLSASPPRRIFHRVPVTWTPLWPQPVPLADRG